MKLSQMGRLLTLCLLLSAFKNIDGQSYDPDSESKGFAQLRKSGELVTLELTPDGKKLKLKLVGNEAARIKLDQMTLEATYGLGKVKQRLTLTKQDGEYLIKRDKIEPTSLQIRVRAKDQVEDFDFRLK
ncbi:MAG: hypothetical protein KDD35_05345 [Bdellovibrionales bacterium]|nr:hypothetical protein [Bdellovibrionales bacterium]